jgi:hypothetical protein
MCTRGAGAISAMTEIGRLLQQKSWSGRRDLNPGPLAPQTRDWLLRLRGLGCFLLVARVRGVCFRSLQMASESISGTFLRTVGWWGRQGYHAIA